MENPAVLTASSQKPPDTSVPKKKTCAATAAPVIAPTKPDYAWPSPPGPIQMETITNVRVTAAQFIIGKQNINVVKQIKDNIKHGYIELPVTAIYTKLKDKGQIVDADASADALNPPTLKVEYLDEDGFHKKDYQLNDTIVLGTRSLWGQVMEKPGDIAWSTAIVAGKIQVVIAIVLFWILMVLWTYKMWLHFNTSGLTYNFATKAKFGDLGVAFAIVAGVLAPLPPTRFLMAFLSALAPIWSFFMQGFFWYFVDSQITSNFPGAPPPGQTQPSPDLSQGLSLLEAYKNRK